MIILLHHTPSSTGQMASGLLYDFTKVSVSSFVKWDLVGWLLDDNNVLDFSKKLGEKISNVWTTKK
jgi:hypothetical protein